jgi:hypothetical protein
VDYEVVLTEPACDDLREIVALIAQDNPHAALTFVIVDCKSRKLYSFSSSRPTNAATGKCTLAGLPTLFDSLPHRRIPPSLVEKLPPLAVSAVERMLLDSSVILEAAIRYIQHLAAAQVDNKVKALFIRNERPKVAVPLL